MVKLTDNKAKICLIYSLLDKSNICLNPIITFVGIKLSKLCAQTYKTYLIESFV